MAIRRYGTFAGGIDLPDEKQATISRQIEPASIDGPLRVPLAWGHLPAARATVEPGQHVARQQMIAHAESGDSVDVFTPVAGTVSGLVCVDVAAGDRMRSCPAVEIVPDEQAFPPDAGAESFDWRAAGAAAVRQRLREGALVTFARGPDPLARWLARGRAKGCDTLIANCMENQPFVTAEHRMLADLAERVASGLAILAKALGVAQTVLAVDQRRTGDYQDILAPARTYDISRVSLHHKYPTGAEAILVKLLTRREMPPGGTVMDVGVATTGAATCLAVHNWVACGIRAVGRVVTVSGARATRPGNYWSPFGASCASLVGRADQPVIHNGPMVGVRCTDQTVVTPSTDAVLAVASVVPASPSPCIRCSWCTDHCPARLNVAELNDAFELSDLSLARRLTAQACVECGVCTYVCPARLPLSQRVKQLKRVLCGLDRDLPLFAGSRA
jgi:electron transport complex protein RnfC